MRTQMEIQICLAIVLQWPFPGPVRTLTPVSDLHWRKRHMWLQDSGKTVVSRPAPLADPVILAVIINADAAELRKQAHIRLKFSSASYDVLTVCGMLSWLKV
ncbi:hypothetical protein EDB83DRAFT_479742 [Lactarius deliciosus]|nr:hypothetical protein EDB83DRAFT_479742 [Lactarius deliciosus]